MPAWLLIALGAGGAIVLPRAGKKIKKLRQIEPEMSIMPVETQVLVPANKMASKPVVVRSDKSVHTDCHAHEWFCPERRKLVVTGPAIPVVRDGEVVAHVHARNEKISNGPKTGMGIPEMYGVIEDHFHVVKAPRSLDPLRTGPSVASSKLCKALSLKAYDVDEIKTHVKMIRNEYKKDLKQRGRLREKAKKYFEKLSKIDHGPEFELPFGLRK